MGGECWFEIPLTAPAVLPDRSMKGIQQSLYLWQAGQKGVSLPACRSVI